MASQIAHIIYAQKYFDRAIAGEIESFPKINKDEFLLGCVFPDIRRIDSRIKRKDTHLRFSQLDLNFAGLSSFEAGWKFHLYCDMRREDILNRCGFYSLKNTTDVYGIPAKQLEEELIYNDYTNWEKICFFFNNAPYIETNTPVTPEIFSLWYAILAKYMEQNPNEKSERIFLSKMTDLAKLSKSIIESVSQLRENKKAMEILEKIKDEIV